MTYTVTFTTAASREVRKLPRPAQVRVLAAAANLGGDPRPPGAIKLAGLSAAWRVRVGDYRILYTIADEVLTVTVVRAAHRSHVYDLQR